MAYRFKLGQKVVWYGEKEVARATVSSIQYSDVPDKAISAGVKLDRDVGINGWVEATEILTPECDIGTANMDWLFIQLLEAKHNEYPCGDTCQTLPTE